MSDDLNDSLSDLLGGEIGSVRVEPVRSVPVYKPADQRFIEGCPKCRGTGQFVSYSGRVLGQCFACKGAGSKSFKTSAATRASNREASAERRNRIQLEGWEAFKAEYPAEVQWMEQTAPRWDLAASLLDAAIKYGNLTEKQMAVVRNGMARDVQRATERQARAANAPTVNCERLEQAFAVAREKAYRPGQMGTFVKPLRLSAGPTKQDIAILFTPGSIGSQWEGMLFAKMEDGRKLGFVKGGRFTRKFDCSDAEQAAVIKCASDPEQAVLAYAKAWSRCGVCGKGLLNDVSIEAGMGPICREKYGWA